MPVSSPESSKQKESITPLTSVASLASVVRIAESRLPTAFGEFTAIAYRDEACSQDHLVLTYGFGALSSMASLPTSSHQTNLSIQSNRLYPLDEKELERLASRNIVDEELDKRLAELAPSSPSSPTLIRVISDASKDASTSTPKETADDTAKGTLVRLHSECLTGDVFASLRCDCGAQLQVAMKKIVAEGIGVIVYLRGHEGRGVGLANKIRAYALQDCGHDTVAANAALNLPVDARDYAAAAAILKDLKLSRIRLMTNNPRKIEALKMAGLTEIERVELFIEPQAENRDYLLTKQNQLGHLYRLVD